MSLGAPIVFCSCRVAAIAVSRRSVSALRLGCMSSWDLLGGERGCTDRLGLGAVWAFLDRVFTVFVVGFCGALGVFGTGGVGAVVVRCCWTGVGLLGGMVSVWVLVLVRCVGWH